MEQDKLAAIRETIYGDLLSVREVAEVLGVCIETVWRMIHRDEIQAKKFRGRWWVHRENLEKLGDRFRVAEETE